MAGQLRLALGLQIRKLTFGLKHIFNLELQLERVYRLLGWVFWFPEVLHLTKSVFGLVQQCLEKMIRTGFANG